MIEQDAKDIIQGTPEWHIAKLGYVSASSIADVMAKGKAGGMSATRDKYLYRLAKEQLLIANSMLPDIGNTYTNEAMEWGVQQESFARQAYEVSRETFVDKTGFWKHTKYKWVGASPDGLVGSDGLVEIKCPNSETHIKYLLNNEVPTEYYKQMQCQLWVTNRQYCDFVSFDSRLPKRNQLFVKRCLRDDKLIADMELATLEFLNEVEVLINVLSGEK